MKIPGKKIKGLSAAMASDEAAARVLGARLRAVRALAPLAAERWREDDEHVHQLRVATRRAASAMVAFGPCLRKKRAKKARKALKALRSAAGPARDADVHRQLFESLRERTDGAEREAVERAIESIGARREHVQESLAHAVREHPDRKLARRFGKLVNGIESPAPELAMLGDLASHTMGPLAASLREEAGVRPWTAERLHRIRIACKKLRYACEVFECCLDEEGARQFKGDFVPLLDALGELNDSTTMVERLEAARERPEGELAGLGGAPREGVDALVRRFEAERDDRQHAATAGVERLLASGFLDRLGGGPAQVARSA